MPLSMKSHGRDMEESISAWNNLGVVETIFEDDDEDSQSLTSPPLSFPLSSPASPLQSSVDAWTASTGRKPDVKVHVRGVCFDLHKDPLMSKSSYLKRQLIRVKEFTLSPPLKIAADTFQQVVDFCYIGHTVITPFNVAALRTAAELLEMDNCDDSLRDITESYFCNVLLSNREFVSNVFRSCLTLLPEAEQKAFLASRCLEELFSSLDDGDSDGAVSCADGLKTVSPEDIRVIAESMQRRYTHSHDVLYRVVDLYFLVYNGKLSEDQKTQICSCIDCSILTGPLLMHAVQNSRMPLRFVVQAMLIEQLNTHRSIFTALNTNATNAITTTTRVRSHHDSRSESPATLGAILERDAALRQVAQLRAAMDTTCSRIQTLESELSRMKKLLGEQEIREKQKGLLMLEDGNNRSSSCRFSSNTNHKVERDERGSVSSSMLRFGVASDHRKMPPSSCLDSDHQSPKTVKKFGQRLIRGLRSAFGVSSKLKDGKSDGGEQKISEYDAIIFDAFPIAKDNAIPHHRSRSVS